jgi:Transglycosylase-like domain
VRAVPLAGAATALLALSPVALAAREADDPPSPARAELSAPVAGHLTVASQMRAVHRAAQERRLRRTVTRLERRVARVRGEQPTRPRLRGERPADLRDRVAEVRRELSAARRERALERVAVPPQLEAIAACESGGDPGAIGGGGLYRGKYQFDFQTWASVGGSGDPAAAPEAEQDMRAAMLYERAGAAPWPVCGR